MKKLICLLLVCFLSLSLLVACNDDEEKPKDDGSKDDSGLTTGEDPVAPDQNWDLLG